MTTDPFRIPTEAEIAEAERILQFRFPAEYIQFLKGGSNVENAIFEAAVILRGSSHLDIFEIADHAWSHEDVSRDWLPFIEDNGDYFLTSESGAVRFWSHQGSTDECWPSFSAWFQQVCIECR
ncbi:SMI1/KNR4 family protein [Pseudomonas sp. S75]|uniref:SMI1/KNR4 family protein n=1 Tax=unclassified Pseudomonas TaxID=196821 RepID=UPI001905CFDA|nr:MULTISPECIES: SMI1/KNR4 family protein [unclassified Pseudomonas]MBJ9975258.1 SMI1/KNR4 family protein [Pseudomonas sp. S30]MBK0152768.1 SMI1/KNR4 family protein [Pseudomonas sp. S75]